MFDIPAIAEMVSSQMVAAVDANAERFLHTDDFESLFEGAFDAETDGMNLKGETYTYLYQWVFKNPIIDLAIETCKAIRDEAREEAADEMEYHESPMKYYGLKQSDFI